MKINPESNIKPVVLRVWGQDEKNYPHEKFDYTLDVPPDLDEKLYWLIAQGILFNNDWTSDGLCWGVSINGQNLK
jgi:hypothetical protein